jgi:hypothetical protein
MRRHALGPCLAPRRRTPRCAKARRSRALTPNWPRPAPVGTLMLRHGAVRLQACEPAGQQARPGMVGLTCCEGGKSHRPKRATHRHQCKRQRSGQRNVLPGQGAPGHLGGRPQQVMPAAPPGAGARYRLPDSDIVLLRCCISLLYQARELWAQDFEFICLTWVELRDSNPWPLACHPQAARPPQSVCAGHRPSACAPVRSDPHRLLYFPAVPASLAGTTPNERLTSQNLPELYRDASQGTRHPDHAACIHQGPGGSPGPATITALPRRRPPHDLNYCSHPGSRRRQRSV